MSGASAIGKKESFRVDYPCLCGAIVDRNGTQRPCGEAAYNAIYSGHNHRGVPYIGYFCDDHDKERL